LASRSPRDIEISKEIYESFPRVPHPSIIFLVLIPRS
jgi:hypothetical protein